MRHNNVRDFEANLLTLRTFWLGLYPERFAPPPKPPPPKISASRNALTLKFSPVVDLDKRRQCTKFQVDDVTI